MTDTKNRPEASHAPPESIFHCGAEWHLTGLAFRIYSLASRLSHKSNRFHPTGASLAAHFKCSTRSIYRAIDDLVEAGFFSLIDQGMFESSVYKVLSHKEWASNNLGMCCVKESMPWSGEADPLGQDLHALSGGRARFREFQIRTIRDVGLSEDEVKQNFKTFVDMPGAINKPKTLPGRFIQFLRKQLLEKEAEKGILQVPPNRSDLRGRASQLYVRNTTKVQAALVAGVTASHG